jgi:hypothetical protein
MFSPNTLTDGVTKVTEGCLRGFWHFWHPLTLGILKVVLPSKRVERRVIQQKRDHVGSPQEPRRREPYIKSVSLATRYLEASKAYFFSHSSLITSVSNQPLHRVGQSYCVCVDTPSAWYWQDGIACGIMPLTQGKPPVILHLWGDFFP